MTSQRLFGNLLPIHARKVVVYLFGLIGAIISLIVLVFWLAVIGLIVLFVASIFIPNKYSEDSVIQRWSSLLVGQAGLASEVLERIEKELNSKNLPYKSKRKEIDQPYLR